MVEGFEKLAKENGAKIIKNSEVKKILTKSGKVTGVKTNKKTFNADIVISNADYHHTQSSLLAKKINWSNKTLAPSAFILYLGLNKKIKAFKHHNLILKKDWSSHFSDIFQNPKWPDSPSVYFSVTSKTDKNVSPKGKDNIFVLVPVSAGLKDSKIIRGKYFKKILKLIEDQTNTRIEKHIIFKKIITINDYKNLYNAYEGTAFGLAHTLNQTAMFRPRHKSSKVKGLFFVGQYTHPGIGVPAVVVSAQIVAKSIKDDKS